MPWVDPNRRREYSRAYMREYRRTHPAYLARSIRRRKEWLAEHPGKEQGYRRKYSYGLTSIEWNAIFVAQGSCCAICSSPDPASRKGWQTDHCHKSGKLRWILCADCNRMLGPKATSALLRRAADMLDTINT